MRIRLALLVFLMVGWTARAERLKPGNWIGTFGLGVMSSPAVLLVSPHLERVQKKNLFFGILIQGGIGTSGTLFTLSATGRFQVGNHPRFRPFMEGGFGLAAAASGFTSSSFGIALHGGLGAEYLVDNNLALSSVLRACFAPPVQTFFIAWPILQVRFLF